jgi:hypothetical protein
MYGSSVANLEQRHQLFHLMRDSHLRWLEETDDCRVKEMHRTISDAFQTLIDQYEVLLRGLGSNIDHKNNLEEGLQDPDHLHRG